MSVPDELRTAAERLEEPWTATKLDRAVAALLRDVADTLDPIPENASVLAAALVVARVVAGDPR